MTRLSPETADLVDSLVGAASLAKRVRLRLEDVEPAGPSDGAVDALPEADEAFVAVLVGLVVLAKQVEGALDTWCGPTMRAEDSVPPVQLRDLLR